MAYEPKLIGDGLAMIRQLGSERLTQNPSGERRLWYVAVCATATDAGMFQAAYPSITGKYSYGFWLLSDQRVLLWQDYRPDQESEGAIPPWESRLVQALGEPDTFPEVELKLIPAEGSVGSPEYGRLSYLGRGAEDGVTVINFILFTPFREMLAAEIEDLFTPLQPMVTLHHLGGGATLLELMENGESAVAQEVLITVMAKMPLALPMKKEVGGE